MKGEWIEQTKEDPKHFLFEEGGSSFYCVPCHLDLQVHSKSNFGKHIYSDNHKDNCKLHSLKEELVAESNGPPLKRVQEEKIDMSVVDRVVKKRTIDKAKTDVSTEEFKRKFLDSPIGQARVKERVLELIKNK